MGGWALNNPESFNFVKNKYLPNHIIRVCGEGECPFILPRRGEFPVYVAYLVEGGLRFPLNPLFVDFLEYTGTTIGSLGINAVRIIHAVAELNRKFNLELGLNEIFYCYSLHKSEEGWCLRSRENSPSLVMCLPTSVAGRRDDVIVITSGPITVPERHVRICEGQVRVPGRPSWRNVKADQLNAICHHDSGKLPDTQLHPRAVHILLNYVPTVFTFASRVSTHYWVGREPRDKSEKFLLFRKYKVDNSFVRYYRDWLQDQARRPGRAGLEAQALLRKAWEQDSENLAKELEDAHTLSVLPLRWAPPLAQTSAPEDSSRGRQREAEAEGLAQTSAPEDSSRRRQREAEAEERVLFEEGFPANTMPPRKDVPRYLIIDSSSSDTSVTSPLAPPSIINPTLARYKAVDPKDLEGHAVQSGEPQGHKKTRGRKAVSQGGDPPRSAGGPSPGRISVRVPRASPQTAEEEPVDQGKGGTPPARKGKNDARPEEVSPAKRPSTSRGKELAAPFSPDYGDLPVRQDQSALLDAGVTNSLLAAMVLPTDLVTLNEKELEALRVEGSHRAYTV